MEDDWLRKHALWLSIVSQDLSTTLYLYHLPMLIFHLWPDSLYSGFQFWKYMVNSFSELWLNCVLFLTETNRYVQVLILSTSEYDLIDVSKLK